MPPLLSLRLLGPPAVLFDGQPAGAEVHWRKHLGLLACLALADNQRMSRAALQALLWPEDEERARRSLNEAVRRLRGKLGRGRLLTSRTMVELAPGGLEVDALSPPPLSGTFRPPLLEGVDYSDAPEFEEWVARARARLCAADIAAVMTAANRSAAAGAYSRAAHLALAVASRDPLHAGAARVAMESLALQGRRDQALDTWRLHVEALRALDEAPAAPMAALAQRIASAPDNPAPRTMLPMVGRQRGFAELTHTLAQGLNGTPTMLLVTGDVGSGRTRLLDACAERAVLAGARSVRVRAVPDDGAVQWSLLRALLRTGLDACPGTFAVPPTLLGVVAWLAPGLAERVAPRPPADEGEVVDAIASLLGAVADEQPVFVAIDDADLADAGSLEAIRLALLDVRNAPVVLALATRRLSAASPAPLLRMAGSVGRQVAGARADLEPFTQEEVGWLVEGAAAWCASAEDRLRLSRRLYHETGGDPLMSVTLLEALRDLAGMRQEMLRWPPPQHTMESPLPVAVPAVLRMALLGRVAALDAADRHLLGVAAATGPRPDPEAVARHTGHTRAQVDAAFVRLERARLVLSDGDGIAFPAPLHAEILAHECLTPGERRALTRRPDRVPA